MKTYLSKDQMLRAENEEEATVYVGLKIMFDKMLTRTNKEAVEVNVNLKQLYYQVSGNFDISRSNKSKLEEGLQGLINSGAIDLIDTDGKDEYVLDIKPLRVKAKRDGDEYDEPYVMMTTEEIHSIFNLPCKNKMNLLRFAIGLFGTFNSYNKCGWTSFRKMPDVTNVPERTCQDYFKLLEDNNIIYVCHSKQAKRDKDGQIKNLSNIYGRPCDKKAIDAYYVMKASNEGYDFTKTMDSTKRGQITRKYKKFVNDAYDGDVIELIKDCLAYNQQPYQAQHEDAQYDLSVFDPDMVAEAEKGMGEHWKEIKAEQKEKMKEQAKQDDIKPTYSTTDSDDAYELDDKSEPDEWLDDKAVFVYMPKGRFGRANNTYIGNSSINTDDKIIQVGEYEGLTFGEAKKRQRAREEESMKALHRDEDYYSNNYYNDYWDDEEDEF